MLYVGRRRENGHVQKCDRSRKKPRGAENENLKRHMLASRAQSNRRLARKKQGVAANRTSESPHLRFTHVNPGRFRGAILRMIAHLRKIQAQRLRIIGQVVSVSDLLFWHDNMASQPIESCSHRNVSLKSTTDMNTDQKKYITHCYTYL